MRVVLSYLGGKGKPQLNELHPLEFDFLPFQTFSFETFSSHFAPLPFSSMAHRQTRCNGRTSWPTRHPGRQLRDAMRHLPHIEFCHESMFSFVEDSRQQTAAFGA